MSIYTINNETALAAGSVLDADELVIYDSAAARVKKVALSSIRQFTSGGIVAITAADAITAAEHAGRICVLNLGAGFTLTLPAATGTGNVYTFVVGIVAGAGPYVIETSAVTEHMTGSVRGVDNDVEGATGYQWNAEASDDTITLNGTATGGYPGDTIIIRDYEATNFTVDGHITQSGASEATPFSAAVS